MFLVLQSDLDSRTKKEKKSVYLRVKLDIGPGLLDHVAQSVNKHLRRSTVLYFESGIEKTTKVLDGLVFLRQQLVIPRKFEKYVTSFMSFKISASWMSFEIPARRNS